MDFRNRPQKEITKVKKIWIICKVKKKINMMLGRNAEENAKNKHKSNM